MTALSPNEQADLEAGLLQLCAQFKDALPADEFEGIQNLALALVRGDRPAIIPAAEWDEMAEAMDFVAAHFGLMLKWQEMLGLVPGRPPTAEEMRGRTRPTEDTPLVVPVDKLGEIVQGLMVGTFQGGTLNAVAKAMGYTDYRDALPVIAMARGFGVVKETPGVRTKNAFKLAAPLATTPEQDAEMLTYLRRVADHPFLAKMDRRLAARFREITQVVEGSRPWADLESWCPLIVDLVEKLEEREGARLAAVHSGEPTGASAP